MKFYRIDRNKFKKHSKGLFLLIGIKSAPTFPLILWLFPLLITLICGPRSQIIPINKIPHMYICVIVIVVISQCIVWNYFYKPVTEMHFGQCDLLHPVIRKQLHSLDKLPPPFMFPSLAC